MVNLIVAVGLALALEGAAYALFPDAMKRAAAAFFAMGDRQMRLAGAGTFAAGALIVIIALATAA